MVCHTNPQKENVLPVKRTSAAVWYLCSTPHECDFRESQNGVASLFTITDGQYDNLSRMVRGYLA